MSDDKKKVWVIGANGGIGLAITQHMLIQGHQVTAMSRHPSTSLQQLQSDYRSQMVTVVGDLAQDDSGGASRVTEVFAQYGLPDWTINASGLLHTESSNQMPEKRLCQISESFLADNIQANTYTSIVIAQLLDSLYKRDDSFRLLCLSAMVGSISDNHSGGWYSYRMSKAALNMFVKTLSIEWQRRFPHACIAAIHPGTTDTPLSIPFQNNISSDKLYTPQLSAERIYSVLSSLAAEDSGKFFHWDGSEIGW